MSFTLHRRLAKVLAILAASSVTLVGCAAVTQGGDGPADAGNADGVVTIFGSIDGHDAELLEQSWADWSQENDIEIRYEPSSEFATNIAVRARTDKLPDLAIFPEPTLFKEMVADDLIQRTPAKVKTNVVRYWSQDWADYATTNGVIYGAPLLAEVNGFVWYSPAQFAAHGWSVPKSWDGLLNLTEKMHTELETAPWCAAGSDGDAGTDWVESLVLGLQGPDAYDRWVDHDLTFSSSRVTASFRELGQILLNPQYVNAGFDGVESISSTTTDDVARALANGTCFLTHQDSSFEALLTDPEVGNATVGPGKNLWAFMTPSAEAGGNSVVGRGGIVAAFSNDADTIKVQEYLSSPEWARSRVALGDAVSANNGVDSASAPGALAQLSIRLLQDQRTTFRFEAAKLMPTVVGEGSFPSEMLEWINGQTLERTLQGIDASWPIEK